jgi:acyl carrier protein
MDTIKDFISKFSEQFEMTNPSEFTQETHFKDLEDWDSLVALSIIGMVHNTYNVKLIGGDIRSAVTVNDVYNMVVSKI